jgi:hypothetical protein
MSSQEITRVAPRVQTITGMHKHELEALLRTEKRAGRIGPNHSKVKPIAGGRMWAVKVVRLADPPPRWRRRLWVGVGGTSAVAVLGAMMWHARYVIGAGLLIAACVALGLWWAATRLKHQGACPGLHCGGCRG